MNKKVRIYCPNCNKKLYRIDDSSGYYGNCSKCGALMEIYKKKKVNAKSKGGAGERELANKLKEYGYNCRRGQQYCGANGDADVVGLNGIHIECKRVEHLNLYDAISQAKADAKELETPAVFHRKNNCEWLVTMTLKDWVKFYQSFEDLRP